MTNLHQYIRTTPGHPWRQSTGLLISTLQRNRDPKMLRACPGLEPRSARALDTRAARSARGWPLGLWWQCPVAKQPQPHTQKCLPTTLLPPIQGPSPWGQVWLWLGCVTWKSASPLCTTDSLFGQRVVGGGLASLVSMFRLAG